MLELSDLPLRLGSQGKSVRILQRKLCGLGSPLLLIDGEFGGETARAVRKFQTHHRLKGDKPGEVGAETARVLGLLAGQG